MYISILPFIFCLLWTVTAQFSGGDRPNNGARLDPPNHASNRTDSQVICEPFGACTRCPDEQLDQPFCRPFGNRQLLHCRSADSVGDTPTWGPCGRIILKERADFLEFAACNAAFTVVGLLVIVARSRRLAYQRSRALAARIGIGRV
ncbi:hypothetical protein BU17DRAFT_56951 [Hysterangium stoloniferum]|nr:hypothetical protein BU17DRAFT_56951 [Hysterangium stoloniferum]